MKDHISYHHAPELSRALNIYYQQQQQSHDYGNYQHNKFAPSAGGQPLATSHNQQQHQDQVTGWIHRLFYSIPTSTYAPQIDNQVGAGSLFFDTVLC